MSDINWIFSIIDQFSAPLKNIQGSLAQLDKTLQQNNQHLAQLQTGFNKTARAAQNFAQGANTALNSFGSLLGTINGRVGSLFNGIKSGASSGNAGVFALVAAFEVLKFGIEGAIDVAKIYLDLIKDMISTAATDEAFNFSINLVLDSKQVKRYQEFINNATKNTRYDPITIKSVSQQLLASTKSVDTTRAAFDIAGEIALRKGPIAPDGSSIRPTMAQFNSIAVGERITLKKLESLLIALGITDKQFLVKAGLSQKQIGKIGGIDLNTVLTLLDTYLKHENHVKLSGQSENRADNETLDGILDKILSYPKTYASRLDTDPSFAGLKKSFLELSNVLSPEGPNGKKIQSGLAYILGIVTEKLNKFVTGFTQADIDKTIYLLTKTIPNALGNFLDVMMRLIKLLDKWLPKDPENITKRGYTSREDFNNYSVTDRIAERRKIEQKLGLQLYDTLDRPGQLNNKNKEWQAYKDGKITKEELSAVTGNLMSEIPDFKKAVFKKDDGPSGLGGEYKQLVIHAPVTMKIEAPITEDNIIHFAEQVKITLGKLTYVDIFQQFSGQKGGNTK
jgi:hypothetical protein